MQRMLWNRDERIRRMLQTTKTTPTMLPKRSANEQVLTSLLGLDCCPF